MERNPEALRVTIKHLVSPDLENPAYRAALAAECAGRQGRFAELHRVLLASQEWLQDVTVTWMANESGVPDPQAMVACVEDGLPRSSIDETLSDARALGLRGTPSTLVGRRLISGTPELGDLEQILLEEGDQ